MDQRGKPDEARSTKILRGDAADEKRYQIELRDSANRVENVGNILEKVVLALVTAAINVAVWTLLQSETHEALAMLIGGLILTALLVVGIRWMVIRIRKRRTRQVEKSDQRPRKLNYII